MNIHEHHVSFFQTCMNLSVQTCLQTSLLVYSETHTSLDLSGLVCRQVCFCLQTCLQTSLWDLSAYKSVVYNGLKTSQCITNIIRCKSDMRKIVVINTRTNTIIWNKSIAKKIKHYKKLFETSALFWYIALMYQSSHFLVFPVTRRQWNVVSKLWQSQH